MMEKVTIEVPVKARDNFGNEHRVVVFRGGQSAGQSLNPATGKLEYTENREWVLRIENTPASWYMKTLLEDRRGGWPMTISIDFGQKWSCTNFGEVLKAAMIAICCAKV